MNKAKYLNHTAIYRQIQKISRDLQGLEDNLKTFIEHQEKKEAKTPKAFNWSEFEEYVQQTKPTRNMLQTHFNWNFEKYDEIMGQAVKRYRFEWDQDSKGFSKISTIRKREGGI